MTEGESRQEERSEPNRSKRRAVWRLIWRAEVIVPLLCAACLFWNTFPYLQLFSSSPAYIHGLDNNYYFAWVRSWMVDGDFDFANDLQHVVEHPGIVGTPEAVAAELEEFGTTPTGLIPNRYGIGSGLLSLPFVAATHLGLQVLSSDPDPYSRWYAAAYQAACIVWGFIGLWFSLLIARRYYDRATAAWATGLAALGLSLGHYLWFEPTLAHAPGFGVLAIFVWLCLRWDDRLAGGTPPGWAVPLSMGLLLGLAVAVRYTNVLFALVPFMLAIRQLFQKKGTERDAVWRISLLSLALAFLGAVIGFAPQMLGWHALYGSFLYYSYEGYTVYPWPRFLPQILFGTWNSLFLWTPLALFACAGVILGLKHSPGVFSAGAAVLLAITWVYGGWERYSLGHSFGMRAYVEASMFLILGLAEVLRRLQQLPPAKAARAKGLRGIMLLLVAWNLYFMFAYRAHVQPPGEPFVGAPLITEADRVFDQIARDLKLNRVATLIERLTAP